MCASCLQQGFSPLRFQRAGAEPGQGAPKSSPAARGAVRSARACTLRAGEPRSPGHQLRRSRSAVSPGGEEAGLGGAGLGRWMGGRGALGPGPTSALPSATFPRPLRPPGSRGGARGGAWGGPGRSAGRSPGRSPGCGGGRVRAGLQRPRGLDPAGAPPRTRTRARTRTGAAPEAPLPGRGRATMADKEAGGSDTGPRGECRAQVLRLRRGAPERDEARSARRPAAPSRTAGKWAPPPHFIQSMGPESAPRRGWGSRGPEAAR